MVSNTKGSLNRLFHPKSIAVVGASPKGGWGATSLENCLQLGFEGNLYAIHPTASEVNGVKAYPSLSALPEVPDTIAVAVPAKHVPGVLTEADALGVGAAVVFASGFGELEETSEETEEFFAGLSEDFRIVGPNCYGISSYRGKMGLWGAPVPVEHGEAEGNLALITQSGNIAMTMAASARLPKLAYAASLGNQVDVDATDCIESFIEDERVKVIALVLEGIRNFARFRSVSERAARQGVTIVALKIGSSKKGEAATVAHTGTLSGDDATYDALFSQSGVIRVDDIEDLVTVASLAASTNSVGGNRLGIFASSGGECGVSADLAEKHELELLDFEDRSKVELQKVLPEYGYITNPFDLTAGGWGNQEIYRHVTATMLNDSGTDVVGFIGDAPPFSADIEGARWPEMIRGAGEAARQGNKPVLLITTTTDVNPRLLELCNENGVVFVAGLSSGFRAIHLLATRDAILRKIAQQVEPVANAQSLLDWSNKSCGILSETEAKEILDVYEIHTPKGQDVATAEEALTFVAAHGYPVVCKLIADDLAHKTEIGGVIVGIKDEAQLRVAVDQILEAGTTELGAAAVRGIRVEQMVSVPDSLELIVGGRNVPAGSVVVVGAGGILTELLADSFTLLWPFTAEDVDEKLHGLRIDLVLGGYRGSAPINRASIVDAALKTGRLLSENPQITELDINPLLVGSGRSEAVALDALISTTH